MIGPGKYDDLCTGAREATGATGALLIIIGGRDGSGFSVQAPLDVTLRLPSLLRKLADDIELDYERGQL